jgi:hypothetical protein
MRRAVLLPLVLAAARPVVVPRMVAGLGALGAVSLTAGQIYQTALGAGFPADVATQMTAIALRESAGQPTAVNLGPGEKSYGLWQINIQGNPSLMARLGLSDPSDLLDPATNARAAYLLWGGNPANLDANWYINRPGYAEAYERYLPVAEAASGAAAPAVSGAAEMVDMFGLPESSDTLTLAFALGLTAVAVIAFSD